MMKSYVISYFAHAEMPIRSLTNISLQYLQCLIVYLNYGIHETAYCHPALEYNIFRMCLFNLFVYMKNVTKQYSASCKVHKASQERNKKNGSRGQNQTWVSHTPHNAENYRIPYHGLDKR